jgi:L-seryl-tRNA(Ser) seleniumtransferase
MQRSNESARLRSLPGMTRLLAARPVRSLAARHGASLVRDLLREALDELRGEIRLNGLEGPALRRAVSVQAITARVSRAAERLLGGPRAVVNATGVVIHTNLGRSVLSEAAARRVAEAARGYVDLEYDVARGTRGSRMTHLAPLMARIVPGAGFHVVNNNAAAILLCLRALAHGREVVVSRGELVEIGGSFRVPDVLAASGARLREIGTTNRTRIADYESAIGPRTGLLLKVHTSNFRVVGFVEDTPVAELVALAQRAGVPLVVDAGSGDVSDLTPLGIRDETQVGELLRAGADLVTFSGDKLLGGPQAGFIVGRPELVERVRKDPLARVCRLDRLQLAALGETLAAHVRGRAFEELPTLRMLALEPQAIGVRAEGVRRAVAPRVGKRATLEIVDGISRTGGGSSPTGERPTRLLAIATPGEDVSAVERRLREAPCPVIGRIQDSRLLLDLRTVLPEQDRALGASLIAAIGAIAALKPRQTARGQTAKRKWTTSPSRTT